MIATTIQFTVLIPPVGKGRPVVTRSGAFTPAKTRNAEQAVRDAWHDAGQPRIDGPIDMTVWAYFSRPKGHFTPKGAMSKKGIETPFPVVHPDWDNIGKLVADALNKYAYADDKAIVDGHVRKRWCDSEQIPCLVVQFRPMTAGVSMIFDLVPQ